MSLDVAKLTQAFPGFSFSTQAHADGGYVLGLEKEGRTFQRVIPTSSVPVHLEWVINTLRRDMALEHSDVPVLAFTTP
ncbi:DUF3509 domain-containing protein [Pseudomonas sp. RIT-PI-AD]|uniref:DUF3509 domain-containing protein n=1 Tax=Pseudomonas sp. RIT-PI-AD TaxID=3035294 RepID=UPI0021D7E8A9|nr:DUF3509 domain-containing protein [Pseudomonas sp. RIT-PI-AD]